MKIKCNDTYSTYEISVINLEGTNFLQNNGKRKGGTIERVDILSDRKIKKQKQPTNANNNGNNTIENYK